MLYLYEKYAPLDTLERYNPEIDLSVTGIWRSYDNLAGTCVQKGGVHGRHMEKSEDAQTGSAME